MKTGIKLMLGVAFAAIAVMAVSESMNLKGPRKKPNDSACYSDIEVQLVMRANGWSERETKTILDLACQYSKKNK